MKASMISRFIRDCELQDTTIHFKVNENSPLYSLSGLSDVGSSSQVVYLDARHEDEQNLPISGSKLIDLLRGVDTHSCKISMLEGYYPNIENKVFEVNHVRIDFLNDGSRQIHLISEVNDV